MMKAVKSGSFGAFLYALLILFSAEAANASDFLIDAPASDTARVNLILTHYLQKIEDMLGIEFKDTVNVVISTDQEYFNQVLQAEFPDWGAAAAIKTKNLIVIKSPSHFRVGKSLDELLGHELGHIMLYRAAGGRWLPRWFEEGFCQLVSGEWRLSQDVAVTRAVWGSGLIPLTALEGVNRFGGAKASLAYAESYLGVSSLVQEFGIQFVRDFLSYYREDGNLYDAFYKSTGYRYVEWVNIWQDKTSQRYRFILYVFDPSVLFPMIAVLFIILYLFKVYSGRKKLKQWQMEERYKGDEQGYSTWD